MNTYLKAVSIVLYACIFFSTAQAQNSYRYSVDLNDVPDDRLKVELLCPVINKPSITFYFPRIVPGTYMNSNYGKYVHNLKAFDKAGKSLPAVRSGDNSWKISGANKLYRISYQVEDTWDSDIDNKVYTMCGTNFEAGKNFVLNTPGVFGHFDGMKKNAFELNFTKPTGFYAATGLEPVSTSQVKDVFRCVNVDELYDSPIMYSLPDTTTVQVGKAKVLVAIYSPRKMATAKFIAASLEKLLTGTKDYLRGKLPVDKYAFIFYFNGEQEKLSSSGAWEHSYSSFYSLEEQPQAEAIGFWVDISAHEFFHIVTPLTISSKEVKEFNFNETHLSKHVWLYEGSTEYDSHHMQVWAGHHSPEKFLATLAQKINYSRLYFNDTLSFTTLSTESAGKWKDEYGNVYMKGALISACLDLYLLKLSGAQYSFRDLKHDLGVKYGKDKYFLDSELFGEIEKLTYPEIKEFLLTHVEGGTPIPYEKYFALAGVTYLPKETEMGYSVGGMSVILDSLGRLIVENDRMNAFGKKMGYLPGDELISLNGVPIHQGNFSSVTKKFTETARDGDMLEVMVKRQHATGVWQDIKLSAPAMKIEKTQLHVLRFDNAPTAAQVKIRNAWLGSAKSVFSSKADSNDVGDIDRIIKALYDVISGPAGKRDWNRFRSLYHPDAYMAAIGPDKKLRKFSPDTYVRNNAPFFEKYSFNEKEIGRTVNQFGNVAQVFTSYEYVAGLPTPEKKRGINSIELVKEGGRWWIMSITWDEESPAQLIPPKYLSAGGN